jgi:DeoR/GlpR family transcriptional regulator of sugar metabolism
MMIEERINDQVIRFFQGIYRFLVDHGQASGTDLANHYGITPQSATTQLNRLVAHQYLVRVHYRAWALDYENIKRMMDERPGT